MSKVIAFTDGASSNNQNAQARRGGWAAVLMLVNEQNQRDERPAAYKELSGKVDGATNNQMELEAIRQVLLSFKRDGVSVSIYTDSEYVIGVLSKNWKVKQNIELVAEIKKLMSKHQVSFEKVAGHTGNEYNERADTLAVAATQINA
jgi:ribonuclease HI